MAEQAPEPQVDVEQQSNGKKKPKSKFGMMMGSMGRSAKKGMARAGRQMAKGAVKAKQAAVEKIGKVPTSEEDPEIISALERLKITKTEVYAISDIARNLYEARLNEATFLIQLADKLKSVRVTQNDPFTAYVQKMGTGLSNLEQVQSEHLKRMEEELVVPLEKFRDIDVEKVQKLKLKYKSGKTHYDISAHKLTKAHESQDQAKIQTAQAKKDAAYTHLTSLRNDLKFQVNNLEQKKQVNLLGNMEQYWSSYAAFASAQSNILSQNTIHKDNYVAPVMMNGDRDEVKNEGYDNDQNDNNTTPPPVNIMDENVPPPPYGNEDNNQEYEEQYDDNYNQYDNNNNNNTQYEENNGPTDDYNPFDE